MTTLWLDLETRSRCDLLKHGLYNYAADPSTAIVIASYAIGMGSIKRWSRVGRSVPVSELQNLLKDSQVEIRAHSASFERLLLKHCWKIAIPPARFCCTAFQARSSSLPGSLADMGRALTAKLQKDPRGMQLIRLLSIPREDGSFNEDHNLYAEFGAYCDQDVGAMRVASLMLPQLDDAARWLYAANESVNDRGLPIDTDLCAWAVQYAEEERDAAEASISRLTGGACTKARGAKLAEWLYERLPLAGQRLMEVTKRRSVAVVSGGARAHAPGVDGGANAGRRQLYSGETYASKSLDAETRAALFALAEEQPEEFDPDALAVLEANDAVMASSVHKFQSMLDTASSDGRLRGAFVPAGAAGTGRFSSHGAQLHNFPRVTAADPAAVRKIMSRHGTLPGPVLEVLKSMLRPAICAGTNRRIVRADWNAIEARALPWLSARASAVQYLDAFRQPGRDLYQEQATICGLAGNRQAGKVVTLALGYGGAEGALAAMCKGYGVAIEAKRPVVMRWRQANRWAPEWWAELERGGRWSLSHPAPVWHPAGRVGLRRHLEGEVPGLRMMLPSGRLLHYPFAQADEEGIRYLKSAWKPKADAVEWPRARLWGGLAAENATQAVCADLLRLALTNAVAAGLPVIGHVHDELVGEAASRTADTLAQDLKDEMLKAPDWAAGLPLAVETDHAPRYKK